MRIATFNVENLFERPRIMSLENWSDGEPVLNDFAELNTLIAADSYGAAEQARMAELLIRLGLERSDTGKYVILRRNKGDFLKRPRSGGVSIIAEGRHDWIGWLELRNSPVNETAMLNTARVIKDVDADILAVIEADNRVALKGFNDQVLEQAGGHPYPHVMLIDGNDPRGIDVGLLTKAGYDIGLMRSHVHDGENGRTVFSRDCPEYEIKTPAGETFWVLVNHFKSKGYGSAAANDARRKLQAEHVARFYARLRAEGQQNIVIMGDLNDTPDSGPLQPLVRDTDLREVSEFPGFDTGAFAGKGTYGLGNDNQKIDFILLSPALFARVTGAGLFRKGAWPGSRPKRWPVYPTIKKPIHTASDHHAVWVDIG